MATWAEVNDFLSQQYESDFGMKFAAGPESFAAVVPHDYGSEVILVMNVSDILIQFAGFLSPVASQNVEAVYPYLKFFGIKKTSSSVALNHFAFLETLDTQELVGPLNLMSKEIYSINQAIKS